MKSFEEIRNENEAIILTQKLELKNSKSNFENFISEKMSLVDLNNSLKDQI